MIIEFDHNWPLKQKFEELVKSMQKRAEEQNRTMILFIDEMPPSIFEECPEYEIFFQTLQDKYNLVHIFMAISPSGRNLNKAMEINFEGKGCFAKQLRTRHRNSYILSNLFLTNMPRKGTFSGSCSALVY